jgi:hypothetical protein
MNKFEQLMEYVINDEEAKARELFHDIVVEKSRQIYEDLMEQDEEIEESADDTDLEESADDTDLEESLDEMSDDQLGGDQADNLIRDVEVEEQGISMEGEEEQDIEDRVVDLEDKLDDLMAEFEAMLGGENDGDEEMVDIDAVDVDTDDEEGFGDPDGMTDVEVDDDELETEGMFNENITLKSTPAPVKTEDGGVNKKSTVAANSGARGAMAKPVHAGANEGGHHDTAAYKNSTKDLIGKVGNTPAQSTQNLTPATKPHLGQASGVNNKSVIK